MTNEIDPFDDLQCEELVPEHWEGSPEPEPLSEAELEQQWQGLLLLGLHQLGLSDAELEQQWQGWKKDNPEQAQILEEIEAFFQTYPSGKDKFK